MSVQPVEHERVVVTYIARTTSVRDTRFEVRHEAPGFKPGVFDVQSIGTVPVARLVRKIGSVHADIMDKIGTALRSWLML
jgi:mRNA interferase MazF